MSIRAYYNDNDPKAVRWLNELIAAGLITPGDVDDRPIEEVRAKDLEGYTRHHFFAGIGGWDAALQLAGWPDDVPVWTGSCPCQPLSGAGKRQGEADDRHLWPAFYHLIAESRPPVVFGEQVAGKLGLEWVSGVRADLEDTGYACGIACIPACGVGAPQRRERVWWVADAECEREGRGEYKDSDKIADRIKAGHQVNLEDQARLGGWATPTAPRKHDNDNTAGKYYPSMTQDCMARQATGARPGPWPTPKAREGGHSETYSPKLGEVVGWATPTPRDHKDGAGTLENVPVNALLGRQVRTAAPWGTPRNAEKGHSTGNEARSKKPRGRLEDQLYGAETESTGALNPAFTCWLMGYPAAWDACGATAMRSSRK